MVYYFSIPKKVQTFSFLKLSFPIFFLPRERNNLTKKISNKISNIFLQNYNRTTYDLDGENYIYYIKNFTPRYEGNLNIVCDTQTNFCKIYKYLLWIPVLNMENIFC